MTKNVKFSGIFKEWCWSCGQRAFWDWFNWGRGHTWIARWNWNEETGSWVKQEDFL